MLSNYNLFIPQMAVSVGTVHRTIYNINQSIPVIDEYFALDLRQYLARWAIDANKSS